jgi:hypothetical protein
MADGDQSTMLPQASCAPSVSLSVKGRNYISESPFEDFT